MKKLLKIFIPLILVVAVGVGAVFAFQHYEPYNLRSIQADPGAQMIRSLRKTGQALEAGLAFKIPDNVRNAPKSGAISMDLFGSNKDLFSNTIYLRDNSFVLTGFTATDSEKIAEYGLWISEESIVASMPKQLGARTYGIYFDTLEEDILNSPLLAELGITADDIKELLDAAESMSSKNESEGTDWKTMLETKKNLEALLNKSAVSVTKVPVIIGNETIEAFCVTYTMTPTQMCEGMDIIASWVQSTESYKTAMAETPEMDNEMKIMLADAQQKLIDTNATTMLEVFLHPSTQVIMAANLHTDWLENKQAGYISASISLGVDPIMSTLYDLTLKAKAPNEGKEEVHIEYHRSHAHNLPGRKLIFRTPDESTTIFDMQINSLTGAFDIDLMDRQYSISGKGVSDSTKTTITITEEDMGEVVFTFIGQAEAPKTPHYLNIFTMSKEEVELLMEYIEGFAPDTEPTGWKTADISISDRKGNMLFIYKSHGYETLGELLTEEGLVITKNGRIVQICDEDYPGEYWDVYVNGEQITGDLFDYILETEASIAIMERNTAAQ